MTRMAQGVDKGKALQSPHTHLSAGPGSSQTEHHHQAPPGRASPSHPHSQSGDWGGKDQLLGVAAPPPLRTPSLLLSPSLPLTASRVPSLLAAMLQMGPPKPSTARAGRSRSRSYSVMSPLRPAPKSRSPAAQHSASTERVWCPGMAWGGRPNHHGPVPAASPPPPTCDPGFPAGFPLSPPHPGSSRVPLTTLGLLFPVTPGSPLSHRQFPPQSPITTLAHPLHSPPVPLYHPAQFSLRFPAAPTPVLPALLPPPPPSPSPVPPLLPSPQTPHHHPARSSPFSPLSPATTQPCPPRSRPPLTFSI